MWSNISRLSVTEPGVELLPGSHRKTEHPIGPQGIEPRSVVPETTVLSVELQAPFKGLANQGSPGKPGTLAPGGVSLA